MSAEEFQIGTPRQNPFLTGSRSPFTEAEANMEQNAEQHAEQHAQHTEARAASSFQADASQVSMMMQMMSLMQEQNRQQAVLLDAVTRRLDALEASRGPQGAGMVPPPPPGIAASMVQQGGCQASGESHFPRMANHRLGSTYRWRTTSHGIADCRSCLGIEHGSSPSCPGSI